mmetsp:Transcript_56933/g.158524  ORF Transcript_56933/g.158524 Transcript_56933/m.158524 type:complete len:263 (+) Transcript_56933:478-1266(+)
MRSRTWALGCWCSRGTPKSSWRRWRPSSSRRVALCGSSASARSRSRKPHARRRFEVLWRRGVQRCCPCGVPRRCTTRRICPSASPTCQSHSPLSGTLSSTGTSRCQSKKSAPLHRSCRRHRQRQCRRSCPPSTSQTWAQLSGPSASRRRRHGGASTLVAATPSSGASLRRWHGWRLSLPRASRRTSRLGTGSWARTTLPNSRRGWHTAASPRGRSISASASTRTRTGRRLIRTGLALSLSGATSSASSGPDTGGPSSSRVAR